MLLACPLFMSDFDLHGSGGDVHREGAGSLLVGSDFSGDEIRGVVVFWMEGDFVLWRMKALLSAIY